MAAIKQLTIPKSGLELIQDPQRVADAFALLNLLLAARAQVVVPSSTRGVSSLAVSDENIIIPIPVMLSAPIANASVTTSAVSVATQFNLLLAALRRTGQLPS